MEVEAVELNIVYLDDHQLFAFSLFEQCIHPLFSKVNARAFVDGDDAMEHILESIKNKIKIDLFITDINHPGLKGDCIAHMIRGYEKQYGSKYRIPILVISMVADNEDSPFYDPSGTVVQKYLTKATSVEEITEAINQLVGN